MTFTPTSPSPPTSPYPLPTLTITLTLTLTPTLTVTLGGALRPLALVGKGAFGPVQLCRDSGSGCTYVVKVMERKAMSVHQRANAMNEARLLREIQHPFVVRMLGSHKTQP